MSLEKELAVAIDLARKAGERALFLQPNLSVRHKAFGLGPVSNADIELDAFISRELSANFPDDIIISEESSVYKIIPSLGRVWFVDPIDGTSSYILGRKDFVIMIGLAIDAHACLGVIFQPALNYLWWGITTSQNKKAQLITADKSHDLINKEAQKLSLKSPLRIIISRHSKSKKIKELIDIINPSNIIYSSSFGLKVMLILNKQADLYICFNASMHRWDTCAPQAIMNAAGALLCDINAKSLRYEGSITHDSALIAARGELDDELFKIIITIAHN
jgi:3'(2'), 5'-bisphosphate nucleotidase